MMGRTAAWALLPYATSGTSSPARRTVCSPAPPVDAQTIKGGGRSYTSPGMHAGSECIAPSLPLQSTAPASSCARGPGCAAWWLGPLLLLVGAAPLAAAAMLLLLLRLAGFSIVQAAPAALVMLPLR